MFVFFISLVGIFFRNKLAGFEFLTETDINCTHLTSFSQLTLGLYEFEVTVDGDGAHGEGYVNVTVKPGGHPKHQHYICLLSINRPKNRTQKALYQTSIYNLRLSMIRASGLTLG